MGSEGTAGFGDDGGENSEKFTRFTVDKWHFRQANLTIFHEQLKPELGFVGFLKQRVEFGAKFGIRPSAGGLPGMGRDRSSRAQQLLS
jgi:hypothetical protein